MCTTSDSNKKLLPVGKIGGKERLLMKAKKIILAIFCAAILLCTGVVCLASADNEGISTHSAKDYSEDASYNGVSLRIRGVSQAPASLSQIVNPSSTKKTYFGEVEVVRSWNNTVYEEDGYNQKVVSGKVLTASVAQDRNITYRYDHTVILHAGETASTPIVKSLINWYGF